MRLRIALAMCAAIATAAPPSINKVLPLGGQRGTEVDVEITGEDLANATSVEFDSRDLSWTTVRAEARKLRGRIKIGATAALGPHLLRVHAANGLSPTAMFNAGQFPAVRESEPNDTLASAQHIGGFPIEVHGDLINREESDFYRFQARAGELWSFDLRSTEIGSHLECKMHLLDATGKRLATNDDREDFDDTPLIPYRFDRDGEYFIHVDQYRGPRAADPRNNTYILRISRLPQVRYVSRLGAEIGRTSKIFLNGARLDSVDRVYLTEVRQAEYYKLTYPYTIPVHIRTDPASGDQVRRIEARLLARTPDSLDAEIAIPADARPGLYRLWTAGSNGVADSISLDISPSREMPVAAELTGAGIAIEAAIRGPRDRNTFRLNARAGEPLHIYTLSHQLGMPTLDTVLEVRDAGGKLIAGNDDVVTGAASLGTPDSSVFFTPQTSGPLAITVFDRLNRGGPGFAYRLKIDRAHPAFQLWTLPENIAIARGERGRITLRMVREMGFENEAVAVRAEDLPAGITAEPAGFREDQAWELGSDGLQMTTPEIEMEFSVADTVEPGVYPIRVAGAAAREPQRWIEAHANSIRGPLTNLFNFVRRPLPAITITVLARNPQ